MIKQNFHHTGKHTPTMLYFIGIGWLLGILACEMLVERGICFSEKNKSIQFVSLAAK